MGFILCEGKLVGIYALRRKLSSNLGRLGIEENLTLGGNQLIDLGYTLSKASILHDLQESSANVIH
jgi:hypothetical protein